MPAASDDAVARHPHLAEPCRAGWVRVDLHCHTMWSGDSTTTPDELAEAVAACALDVVCITDHHAIAGARRLAGELACRVVVGEEVRTQRGELIGWFLTERIAAGHSPLDTAASIRAQGGLVYVPHPFDPLRHNLHESALADLHASGLIDAVEAFNAKTSLPGLNARAGQWAAEHGVAAGAGSDAHVPGGFGAAFVEMPDFDGPGSFLDSLRRGRLVGHHWDRPRPWTARVLPGTTGD